MAKTIKSVKCGLDMSGKFLLVHKNKNSLKPCRHLFMIVNFPDLIN